MSAVTALRQFAVRVLVIDAIISRDLWDKYVRGVGKRNLRRPLSRGESPGLRAWVDKQQKPIEEQR